MTSPRRALRRRWFRASLGSCLALLAAPALAQVHPDDIVVIAHRAGTAGPAPELTLPAFDNAINVGSDWVECDVHVTADRVPICFHDFTVDRTTDGTGPTASFTLEEIKALDAGSWFDEAWAGIQVPTLEEALTLMNGRTTVILDIKVNGIGPEIRDVVDRVGFPDEDLVGWVRFGRIMANEFSSFFPTSRVIFGLGTQCADPARIAASAAAGDTGVACTTDVIDQALVDDVQAEGMLMVAYPPRFGGPSIPYQISLGVDATVVENPEFWAATIASCHDGIDNDGDGLFDFPEDPGCFTWADASEEPDCSDGLRSNRDDLTDFPDDPGCEDAEDPLEDFACEDGFDNDGDGFFDFPEDPGCALATSHQEAPACDDGLDNDDDGATDFPDDLQCTAAWDEREASARCGLGHELVLLLLPAFVAARRRR
ncbi:MAG: hypothetical protein MJE66_01810 [Proteobacteria bacterium]|nr:hypothetical protein [Pseudomonadota bacterium]